ncbi:hypothetical protein BCR43DRAFT_488694 [Syncephalastrum racemosum]|uniref:Dynactin subunit 3 n=1 Tax=Syncephalastrum racemosum TaxID=13706 RepID=A0A1X2HJ16_SYNRA|nr:hypothetical protein BCR43DRAFT_488694 [Syncephalastrum racemosum]
MDPYGFESRLRHLEHVVTGTDQHDTNATVLQRLERLQKELHALYRNNKTIHDFIDKYETHAKVLNPAESSLALEREILTPDTKLELIMAAYDDLEKYASEIKQVKSLEHVMSGTEFEAVEKLGQELAPLEAKHTEQARELNALTQRLARVMDNYNAQINTLSEIFISWDDILSTMEVHVSALEAQQNGATA